MDPRQMKQVEESSFAEERSITRPRSDDDEGDSKLGAANLEHKKSPFTRVDEANGTIVPSRDEQDAFFTESGSSQNVVHPGAVEGSITRPRSDDDDEGDSNGRHNESPFVSTSVDEENGTMVLSREEQFAFASGTSEHVVQPGAVRVAGPGQDQGEESMWSRESLEGSYRQPDGESTSTLPPPVVLEARLVENDDRTQILEENRRLREQMDGTAQAEVIVASDGGKNNSIVLSWCSRKKRLSICVFLVLVIVVLGVVLGFVFGRNSASSSSGNMASSSSGNTMITPSPEPTPEPTPPPSSAPSPEPTPDPTLEPSPAPSPVPPPLLSNSSLAPNRTNYGGTTFDHLTDVGYTPSNEPTIHKIHQIKVYATSVCANSDCSEVRSEKVMSLVVTYVLRDCTEESFTNGAYTGTGRTPVGTINLRSDQFITRIELLTGTYVTHIKVCISATECFGPFGDVLEEEPTTIFEKNNSVIKAFHGRSGSWLNALGVYFEENGPSSPTCG